MNNVMDQRDVIFDQRVRAEAKAWEDWLKDFPLGSRVKFMGSVVFVWNMGWWTEDHGLPNRHSLHPLNTGFVRLAWHTKEYGVKEFTVENLEQAKSTIRLLK